MDRDDARKRCAPHDVPEGDFQLVESVQRHLIGEVAVRLRRETQLAQTHLDRDPPKTRIADKTIWSVIALRAFFESPGCPRTTREMRAYRGEPATNGTPRVRQRLVSWCQQPLPVPGWRFAGLIATIFTTRRFSFVVTTALPAWPSESARSSAFASATLYRALMVILYDYPPASRLLTHNRDMALRFTTSYLEDSLALFRHYKNMVEKAMAQVSDQQLVAVLDGEMNSIAVIVKHLSSNMRSRWTDFLTSDGGSRAATGMPSLSIHHRRAKGCLPCGKTAGIVYSRRWSLCRKKTWTEPSQSAAKRTLSCRPSIARSRIMLTIPGRSCSSPSILVMTGGSR